MTVGFARPCAALSCAPHSRITAFKLFLSRKVSLARITWITLACLLAACGNHADERVTLTDSAAHALAATQATQAGNATTFNASANTSAATSAAPNAAEASPLPAQSIASPGRPPTGLAADVPTDPPVTPVIHTVD